MSAWLFLLQQAACAWSLLLSLGLCMGLRKASALRLGITALACGGISLGCAAVDSIMLRLPALVCITVLAPLGAWQDVPRNQRRRMVFTSLVLSLLMAGCARLLGGFGLSRTPLVLMLFALLPLLSHLLPTDGHTPCVAVEITHAGFHLELTALVDSGNLLRDPITQLPVIVISQAAAARLMPYVHPDMLAPGMRLISVRTIAGSSLMPVFRPSQVRLLLPQGWQTVSAVIGLSPDGYSGFQALLPACLLSSAQGGLPLCP